MKNLTEKSVFQSYKALLEGETDWIANLANTAAFIHNQWQNHWTGFYLVKNNELILGPFQGPVACTRIAYGKGVCGTAWKNRQTIVVEDVDAFPGHIACSALSRSEIVVPLIQDNRVLGVLDLDSDQLGFYTEEDGKLLERLMTHLSQISQA